MAESANTQLVSGLKQLLGHTYVMYFRAHSAHWNVEGEKFVSLHKFFSDIYEDVFSSIDHIAESIRQHNQMAPVDLVRVLSYGTDQTNVHKNGDSQKLLTELQELNKKLRVHLNYVRGLAESAGDYGLANFIQDREAAHLKWEWQIRVQLT